MQSSVHFPVFFFLAFFKDQGIIYNKSNVCYLRHSMPTLCPSSDGREGTQYSSSLKHFNQFTMKDLNFTKDCTSIGTAFAFTLLQGILQSKWMIVYNVLTPSYLLHEQFFYTNCGNRTRDLRNKPSILRRVWPRADRTVLELRRYFTHEFFQVTSEEVPHTVKWSMLLMNHNSSIKIHVNGRKEFEVVFIHRTWLGLKKKK
jgi:hypothetical protein